MMESNNSSTEYTTFERDLSLTIGILLLVISLATIIANALLLTAICYDPYKCLRNVPIVFVANLAVADLLTGLAVDPLLAVYNFGIYRNKYYLRILLVSYFNAYLTVTNAVVTTVILIIDRSVAIKKPFLYRRVMTLKSAAIIVAISWIYSGFFCTIPLMGMSEKAYDLLDIHLHVTFSFFSLTLLFAFIYSNLKTEERQKLKEVTSMVNIDNATKQNIKRMKSDRRLLVTIFFILSFFFLTYSPYAVFIHLEYFCTSCNKSKFYYFLSKTSEPVVYLNSVLNPFIYAWRHQNFRRALRWVVNLLGRRRTNVRKYGTNRGTKTAKDRVVAGSRTNLSTREVSVSTSSFGL
ncbi:beta-2 adrenergic receptor-like [Dendronephthya gigantea]|uniref:beta-2 adrenergic receptor-like n=1 Tax=Dendronephthya gigantea TaxID=151771 RepID=UPI00106B3460|nr:beta-2 adrenergic receptor-like [Dendronephthya gigantea]XP_028407724.1 beta-2 adrenergic receptor-like [Dendronephthya gigantea]